MGKKLFTDKIDVAVATKNNARTIGECLKSIRQCVPVRNLFVIDGHSSDDTVKIAKEHGATVVSESGYLGAVRLRQAELCEGEWMLIVDSDIYLSKNWWSKVSEQMAVPDAGMILAVGSGPVHRLFEYERYCQWIWMKYGEEAFSNTLVRRRFILECAAQLSQVHAGEDAVVAKYLRSKGYRVVTVKEKLVYHDKEAAVETPIAFYRWGRSIYLQRNERHKILLKTIRNIYLNYWRYSTATGEWSLRLLLFFIYLSFSTFRGYADEFLVNVI